jgi:hypothetical protein
MTLRRRTLIACAVLAGLGAFSLVLAQRAPAPIAAPPRDSKKPPAAPAGPAVPPGPPWPRSIRSLVIGGGPLPDSSEISLEQNVKLALGVLPGPSIALFGGGPGTQSVRIDDVAPERSLMVRLGELFAPRPSRSSRFRASELDARRADLASAESAIARALAENTRTPLTLYIAAHGEQAEAAADNAALVWGNDALTARRIAELHDPSQRPLQLIVTSCFSGGFAELAFVAADEKLGAARAPRCGLFAGPWDRETSGCDPDPNRAAQESYSLHMLQALAQRDRDGQPLALERVDFDRDGRVSPLEAHGYARIAARSIDMPTTTSERYLRSVQRDQRGQRSAARARSDDAIGLLPEDAAVAGELSRRLELPDEDAARRAFEQLGAARAEQAEAVAAAEEAVDRAYWPLVTRLLERFPVLDNPYHPQLSATLAAHAADIDALLDRSPEAEAHRAAAQALAALDQQAIELELRETVVMRLVRARETLALAAALARRGGDDFTYYRAFLACERAFPGGDGPTPRDLP